MIVVSAVPAKPKPKSGWDDPILFSTPNAGSSADAPAWTLIPIPTGCTLIDMVAVGGGGASKFGQGGQGGMMGGLTIDLGAPYDPTSPDFLPDAQIGVWVGPPVNPADSVVPGMQKAISLVSIVTSETPNPIDGVQLQAPGGMGQISEPNGGGVIENTLGGGDVFPDDDFGIDLHGWRYQGSRPTPVGGVPGFGGGAPSPSNPGGTGAVWVRFGYGTPVDDTNPDLPHPDTTTHYSDAGNYTWTAPVWADAVDVVAVGGGGGGADGLAIGPGTGGNRNRRPDWRTATVTTSPANPATVTVTVGAGGRHSGTYGDPASVGSPTLVTGAATLTAQGGSGVETGVGLQRGHGTSDTDYNGVVYPGAPDQTNGGGPGRKPGGGGAGGDWPGGSGGDGAPGAVWLRCYQTRPRVSPAPPPPLTDITLRDETGNTITVAIADLGLPTATRPDPRLSYGPAHGELHHLTQPGTHTLIVPEGRDRADIAAIGAGGAGKYCGGKAGKWAARTLAVTPGDTITVIVGRAGDDDGTYTYADCPAGSVTATGGQAGSDKDKPRPGEHPGDRLHNGIAYPGGTGGAAGDPGYHGVGAGAGGGASGGAGGHGAAWVLFWTHNPDAATALAPGTAAGGGGTKQPAPPPSGKRKRR